MKHFLENLLWDNFWSDKFSASRILRWEILYAWSAAPTAGDGFAINCLGMEI